MFYDGNCNAKGRSVEFILFPNVLALWEMPKAWFKIWGIILTSIFIFLLSIITLCPVISPRVVSEVKVWIIRKNFFINISLIKTFQPTNSPIVFRCSLGIFTYKIFDIISSDCMDVSQNLFGRQVVIPNNFLFLVPLRTTGIWLDNAYFLSK